MGANCYNFLVRSRSHGLNRNWVDTGLGNGNEESEFCGNGESVSHVLWECLTCSSSRADCLLESQEKLGNGFECFDVLGSLGKSCHILGSELQEDHFISIILALVKVYIVNVLES